MTQHPRLFEPIQLGRYQLKHRIALAPLTRCRADETDGEGNGQLPNELMAEYYGQRASDGGLLINEATPINPLTRFSERVPGIFTQKQIERWRLSTDAVHAKGGLIFLQLWHIGYHCRARFDPEGRLPPSASVILGEETGEPKSRELSVEEIKEIVQDYATAAKNSIEAGFDGVEIHGANTYLIDQFLSDKINKRTDDYGGSVEKRSRFLLEVVDAVVQAIGADRVGIRFSPWAISTIPVEQFSYALEKLNPYNLAFVHLVRQRLETPDDEGLRALRNSYKGVLILCRQYEPETAEKAVADGLADIIAFGKLFISNPDLPNRIRKGAALAPWDDSTFYSSGPVGYTDYKSLAEE
ncbi:NADH:flavin oxidoreductase [Rhizoclosmatium globosum]|uniref:NADH:flavin oxidoreductase n=1 Tax=Rhizoclosmatium globosum TaxID=329046 RepID=A0A1Y2BP46_9FUNG|nr:NADH:flavin oxidoreductase [Rhizoclosmatium globosum]|eukprot:ORY36519.1 NADH:flavin oxidoreductase [Rhizoclosmatium globosum]